MTDEILFETLPYTNQLGLNISIARKYIANPPLTQQQLASKLGRSQNYISKIERGEANPTVQELELMAGIFGLDLLELKPRFRRSRFF